jgi:hypothetical protein
LDAANSLRARNNNHDKVAVVQEAAHLLSSDTETATAAASSISKTAFRQVPRFLILVIIDSDF